MNRDQLLEFTTGLLDGATIDDTLFDSLLDIAQLHRENLRPWVVLRIEDSTQTALTSDTYLSSKNLPSDFRKFYSRFPVVLTDNDGNAVRSLREIPLNMKNVYRNDPDKFYVNYATKKLYICGNQSQNLTIRIFYIVRTPKLTSDYTSTWALASYDDFEKILGLDVAVYHKLGVDYDIINNAQGNANAALANMMLGSMTEWDNELALSTQQGVDYGSSMNRPSTEMSGSVNNLL